MDIIAQPVNTRIKPTTRIRRQLAATPLQDGAADILRNGEPVGHITRVHSAYGMCYEVELGGRAATAARDIPNALDAAAVHIWRAEAAAPGGGSCSI